MWRYAMTTPFRQGGLNERSRPEDFALRFSQRSQIDDLPVSEFQRAYGRYIASADGLYAKIAPADSTLI
ncbi:hypothetical protein V496_04665 [Pseudogymnoascus sp. VKM F-4515 (FW-2607)]|nr:hypothetical protein V496_04665 [Pseudogymnoascus sp. VKM F-4515 (FW-2607)]KFY98867.1 hypothetical protein V498_01170 [Pseudogymnoascus sp. VKM F-4517 (FW-2822)]